MAALRTTLATSSRMNFCQPTTPEEQNSSLSIIFDIDGTLIAEGRRIKTIILRPGAIDFIQWATEQGHEVALWTAGHSGWANAVARKLCQTLHGKNTHNCLGRKCSKTFGFVWGEEKLSRRARPRKQCRDLNGCLWCEFYASQCSRCTCVEGAIPYCPCRYVKDLRTVGSERNIKSARTLIVENTPQCIRNYGNAIYVPTYK